MKFVQLTGWFGDVWAEVIKTDKWSCGTTYVTYVKYSKYGDERTVDMTSMKYVREIKKFNKYNIPHDAHIVHFKDAKFKRNSEQEWLSFPLPHEKEGWLTGTKKITATPIEAPPNSIRFILEGK